MHPPGLRRRLLAVGRDVSLVLFSESRAPAALAENVEEEEGVFADARARVEDLLLARREEEREGGGGREGVGGGGRGAEESQQQERRCDGCALL